MESNKNCPCLNHCVLSAFDFWIGFSLKILFIILHVFVFLFGLGYVGISLATLLDPGFLLSEGPAPTRLEVLPKSAALLLYGITLMGSCMNLSKVITIPAIFVLAIGAIFYSGAFIYNFFRHLKGYLLNGPYGGSPIIVFLSILPLELLAIGTLFLAWRQLNRGQAKGNAL